MRIGAGVRNSGAWLRVFWRVFHLVIAGGICSQFGGGLVCGHASVL